MTTGVAPASPTPTRTRLGSFEVTGRLTVPAAPANQMILTVVGADGTAVAGKKGTATCVAKPADEAKVAAIGMLFDNLKAILHPAISPVLETGIQPKFVYWVVETPAGQTVASMLTAGSMQPSQVCQVVQTIAIGLQTAHSRRVSHGRISADMIRLVSSGAAVLDGLGLNGRGASTDQRDLALTAVHMLRGAPWTLPVAKDADHIAGRVVQAQAIRDALPSCTERLVTVLVRALEADAAARYPSIADFGNAFREAVTFSAEDLVHGAYECISARNLEFAGVLYDRARQYDPSCEALTVLGMQLHGGSLFSGSQQPPVMPVPAPISLPPPPGFPQTVVPPLPPSMPGMPTQMLAPQLLLPPPQARTQSLLPPELAEGLPPEYLESVARQFEVAPTKKRTNSMLYLILGAVLMVGVMLVAVFLTWSLT
jgi:hypothetical protein